MNEFKPLVGGAFLRLVPAAPTARSTTHRSGPRYGGAACPVHYPCSNFKAPMVSALETVFMINCFQLLLSIWSCAATPRVAAAAPRSTEWPLTPTAPGMAVQVASIKTRVDSAYGFST